MAFLNLNLLLHNLVALCVAVVALMLLSQLVVTTLLWGAGVMLRLSAFKSVLPEDREAFRRRVRRGALVWVAILGALLVAAMLYGSFRGIRALDVAGGVASRLIGDDLGSFKTRLLTSAAVALGAIVLDTIARGIAAALGKAISRFEWIGARREALTDLVKRLRTGLRIVILCGAVIVIGDKLELSPGSQRYVMVGAYVLGAFYVSRFVASVAYLVVDVLFDNSTRLATVESPLKYIGNLKHLAGITKRVVDYCVYLSAATWVADEITPDTWLSRGGRIGIRIIAIFYASRVLVELCVLLIQDLFLKVEKEDTQTLQQRKTLVPVAVGFLRYGIYFTALVMGLREANVDPTPLLAGAGVVGVAIGFGAQTFVGDIVAGFFILFENLLLVGDLVEIGGILGRVEEIGVRITKIRHENGVLHSIPNGEVRKVANHSRAYVNAVIDVHVPYEEDLKRVRELLVSVMEKELQVLTGAPGHVEVTVEELTEGSVMLRVTARVPPGESKDMGDVLRLRVLEELINAKISAPRARRVVMIESRLHVGAPPALKQEEEEAVKPFEPKDADGD